MTMWETKLAVRRITQSPVIVFRKDELTIGWGDAADLELLTADDEHGKLSVDDDGRAWVRCLSPRGMWINGTRITGQTPLEIDDELAVAHDRLEIGEQIIKLAAAPAPSPSHSRWQLSLIQLEATPPTHELFRKREIVIGRVSSDLVLSGEDVSAPHCKLEIDDAGRIHVTDLGSELGTSINGVAITSPRPLEPDDELHVAEYVIHLEGSPRSIAPLPAWEVTLEIQERGATPRTETFRKDVISIGRVKGNDIVLPKGNVSKRHCSLHLRDGKVVVVDNKSTNGMWVNGRKITSPVVVRPGDKMYVGDFVIVLAADPVQIES